MAQDPQSVGTAEQEMLLRTWPRTKTLIGTVVSAGTPVVVDLSVLRGKTCFFKAKGGDVFGITYQLGDAVPVIVAGEDFQVDDGKTEELYVWGDSNLRLTIDASANGTELFALHDDTP